MHRLTRYWFLTRLEKQGFFEAALLLLLSNICLKTIAFKHIHRFLDSRWNGIVHGVNPKEQSELVQRSVSRAANVLPFECLCLSRSIAAFVMLRRRGVPAVVFAGLRKSGQSFLEAHAWVDAGQIEDDENSAFATLIRIGATGR
jgi:Transglutaminase-like superfamily